MKIIYSNTNIFSKNENRVKISVARIYIEFDVVDLNTILKTKDEGLELYLSKKELKFVRYTYANIVWNICRRFHLFMKYVRLNFMPNIWAYKSKSYTAYFSLWSILGGHADQVMCLDVTLLDYIL